MFEQEIPDVTVLNVTQVPVIPINLCYPATEETVMTMYNYTGVCPGRNFAQYQFKLSEAPSESPTDEPTTSPTGEPTYSPTDEPTNEPTDEPTDAPTDAPTVSPTAAPVAPIAPTSSPVAPTD